MTDNRCNYKVWTGSYINPQRRCSRKNGHGNKGLYCKQHAKIMKKRKDKQ